MAGPHSSKTVWALYLVASLGLPEAPACGGDGSPASSETPASPPASRLDAAADAASDAAAPPVAAGDAAVTNDRDASPGRADAGHRDAGVSSCAPWPEVVDEGGCPSGSPGAPAAEQEEATADGRSVRRNLTYATIRARALQGDLWLPTPVAGSAPGILVVVHGGGWTDCARRRGGTEWYASAMSALFGIGAFNIEYRLVQDGGAYPENMRDVTCAVQWIAAHAADYSLDGGRIVIAGESAGAQLALMAALTQGSDDLDPGCGPAAPIAGAIAFSAPTDLAALVAEQSAAEDAVGRYVGTCTRSSASCRQQALSCEPCVHASPIAHVCAPAGRDVGHFVLVQAEDPFDPLIPESQARALASAFEAAGVPHELVVVDAQTLRAQGCESGVLDLRTPHGLLQGQTCLTTPSGPAVERLVRSVLLD